MHIRLFTKTNTIMMFTTIEMMILWIRSGSKKRNLELMMFWIMKVVTKERSSITLLNRFVMKLDRQMSLNRISILSKTVYLTLIMMTLSILVVNLMKMKTRMINLIRNKSKKYKIAKIMASICIINRKASSSI